VARDGDLRERHVGELMSQLATDTGTLVRQEMELARAELMQRMDAVRGEMSDAVELARTETAQKLEQAKYDVADRGKKAGGALGMFGIAGIATLLALGALTACLILLLNRWMRVELAALVVAAAWGLVAAAAALRGRDKAHEATDIQPARYVPTRTIETMKDDLRRVGDVKQLVPEQTIETVKEDVEWAKTRGRSDRT
jgi:hypothetical protein